MEKQITLHGIVLESPSGGYTGYFSEFPEAVAEGETEEETRTNLFKALKIILEFRREEYSPKDSSTQKTTEFNLEMA